jgi:hypothetical protein
MFIFLRPLYNKMRFKQGLSAYENKSSARQLGLLMINTLRFINGVRAPGFDR